MVTLDCTVAILAIAKRKGLARLGEYRAKRLILGYYDAYAAGDLSCWLGPDDKR